jgi:hypothetical protein
MDYLPIYITFNNTTPIQHDSIKTAITLVTARILHSFIQGVKNNFDNYKDDSLDYSDFYTNFSK